jgi:hypothetical protein
MSVSYKYWKKFNEKTNTQCLLSYFRENHLVMHIFLQSYLNTEIQK